VESSAEDNRSVRVRIATTALAVALAAGCSGSHGAASGPSWARHSGLFRARVRFTLLHPGARRSAGPPQRILIDTATGRFRITGGSSFPVIAVSGSRTATQAWGSAPHRMITEYRGSRRFRTDEVGGIPLRIVEGFLSGAAPPRGVRLRVISNGPPASIIATTATEQMRITVRRAGAVSAGAFRTATGKPSQIVRQLRPGARPAGAVPAYWLGPTWHGLDARSSSAATRHGGWYTVDYPHLGIDVTPAESGLAGGTPVTIGDGTRGTIRVAAVKPDGSVSFSSGSSGNGKAVVEGDILFLSTGADTGRTMAFVFLPHAMITLSGSAVTPRSAAAIARSLRPL
jgi:hypothetical protein